jgi:hypothetical protein
MHSTFCSIMLLTAATAAYPAERQNTLSPEEKKDGFVLLFNGKDLTGWDGAPAIWTVRDGAIVGSTEGHPLQHNSFLVYKDEFANFILRADLKLRNHNSGIQFRSRRADDWVVTGVQADASEVGPENSAWGNLYDEKGKGRNVMRSPNEGWLKGKAFTHHGDWNSYEVVAQGSHVILRLNGVETINQEVDVTDKGVIAIQMHMGPAMEVQVRNVRIKALP